MRPKPRVAVKPERPWPDRPFDGGCPSRDRRVVRLLSGEDDEVGPVHGGDVADPVHRPHREDQHLDPGAQTEDLQSADVYGVEIELIPRRVDQHDGCAADGWWRQAPGPTQ